MPLYTFNFTSNAALGEARTFVQQIQMPVRPPRGARFYIRQVSATSTDSISTSFKYINVYIPELMGITDQTNFIHYTSNANGTTTLSSNPYDGFRYYLDDTRPLLTINAFPNLNLGRHHIHSHTLTLQLTPFASPNVLGTLSSYSVVLEWSTE
jgi:hypothetical protein